MRPSSIAVLRQSTQDEVGTKVAAHYIAMIPAGETETVLLRLLRDTPTASTTLIHSPMPRRSSPPASPRPMRSMLRLPPSSTRRRG